jgi:hypothetical protein
MHLGLEHEHPIAIDVLFRHSARREAFIEPFPDMTTIKITDSSDCSHRLCLGLHQETSYPVFNYFRN